MRWPQGDSPPRIPPRDRRKTRRGGIVHVSNRTARSWPARGQPGSDIVKEHGRAPGRDAQEVRPTTLARTPVVARDQMHLDLYTNDQPGEVERLVGIGAKVVRHNRDPEDDYVVMTD